ncbi:MAG TPA: DUF4124 domain-containing protein [Methylomirabilota bacterium]|jgi:hypothetical protein
MRADRLWLLVTLTALTIGALPARAQADARDYPGILGDGARLRNSGRFDGNRRFDGDRHRFRRPLVVPSIVIIGPSDFYSPPPTPVYAPPPVIYAPPAYAPPAYYAPPASYYAPPPRAVTPPPAPTAPPEPTVVEFDSGRYELRGDGLREPYTWVWVPKAPTAPPGQASAPRPPATIYRWVDERGVTTLTDDPAKVPPQFRALDITPR